MNTYRSFASLYGNQLLQDQQRQLVLNHQHVPLYIRHSMQYPMAAENWIIEGIICRSSTRRNRQYLNHEASVNNHQPQKLFFITFPLLLQALETVLQLHHHLLQRAHKFFEWLVHSLEEVEKGSMLVRLHRLQLLLAIMVRAEGDHLRLVDLRIEVFDAARHLIDGMLCPLNNLGRRIDVFELVPDINHPAPLTVGHGHQCFAQKCYVFIIFLVLYSGMRHWRAIDSIALRALTKREETWWF